MAIDFLLLAHGHGCEDFDGMCCMDLEDNSSSIHKEIKQLMDHSQQIKKEVGFFGLEGLTNWLGLGGWIKGLIQSLLLVLIMIVIGLLIFSCALSCIKKLLTQIASHVWLVQNKNGGIVGTWLADRGHVNIEKLSQQEFNNYRTQLV